MLEIKLFYWKDCKKDHKIDRNISAPNWLRSIDKRGNTIQSLSASNRDWIIQSISRSVKGFLVSYGTQRRSGRVVNYDSTLFTRTHIHFLKIPSLCWEFDGYPEHQQGDGHSRTCFISVNLSWRRRDWSIGLPTDEIMNVNDTKHTTHYDIR